MRTLRNAIDWSYTLLSPTEQTLFARLGVFAGGCTYEAAEAVCNADSVLDVLDEMISLVEESLLRQQGQDEVRFQMLDTIQEYAAERLEERGEGETIWGMHATYFLALAVKNQPSLGSHQDDSWWAPPIAERDNLRRALDRLLDAGKSEEAARLATALHRFWAATGTFTEGRQRLETALAQPGMQGFWVAQDGDYECAGRIFAEESALRRDPKLGGDLAGALINVGWAALHCDNLDDAHAAYAESLQIVASQGRPALAALLIGAADALQEAMDASNGFWAQEKRWLDPARSAMSEAAWDKEYARGRALSPGDAALQYAGERGALTR